MLRVCAARLASGLLRAILTGAGYESGPLSSVAGEDAIDELLDAGHEAVGVERILLEAIGGMAGKHQIMLERAAMGDVLQGFLDAEAARIGQPAGRVDLIVRP